MKKLLLFTTVSLLALGGCALDGEDGARGPMGPAGKTGATGPAGEAGKDGTDGKNMESKDPVDPKDPINPKDPITPVDPVDPKDPGDPVDPVVPTPPNTVDQTPDPGLCLGNLICEALERRIRAAVTYEELTEIEDDVRNAKDEIDGYVYAGLESYVSRARACVSGLADACEDGRMPIEQPTPPPPPPPPAPAEEEEEEEQASGPEWFDPDRWGRDWNNLTPAQQSWAHKLNDGPPSPTVPQGFTVSTTNLTANGTWSGTPVGEFSPDHKAGGFHSPVLSLFYHTGRSREMTGELNASAGTSKGGTMVAWSNIRLSGTAFDHVDETIEGQFYDGDGNTHEAAIGTINHPKFQGTFDARKE